MLRLFNCFLIMVTLLTKIVNHIKSYQKYTLIIFDLTNTIQDIRCFGLYINVNELFLVKHAVGSSELQKKVYDTKSFVLPILFMNIFTFPISSSNTHIYVV